MSTELRPLGVRCNIACQYCYQHPHRDAGQGHDGYDLEAMKSALDRKGEPFHVFGGEPLLMPRADLEELFRWGLERFGTNGIQTNGVLVDEALARMFRRYQVGVGLSLDGPGPLNDARWAGTLERTRAATARSERAIELLLAEAVVPGMMVQLNRANASAARLPALLDWFRHLDRLGVRTARLHILEVDHPEVRARYALTTDENIEAIRALLALEPTLRTLRFDLGADARSLLQADDDDVPCVWRACDPYTTEAVDGIDGMGRRHNCGLTDKEGIDFQKPDRPGYERYLALYHTPQEHGGCGGCRFFLQCKGQCPGTAIDGDWRNRTEYCAVWKDLFTRAEAELLAECRTPLSLDDRRTAWGFRMLAAWREGRNPTLASLRDEPAPP